MKFSLGGHTEKQAIRELDKHGRNGKAIVKEAKADGNSRHHGAHVTKEKDGSFSVSWNANADVW